MKKKKWKDIRSAVTMMCVMLAMISTATYAWFTMSESATVTGLQMTATTSGGLLVSTDRANWKSAVDLRATTDEASQVLTPVSVVTEDLLDITVNNVDFKSPTFQMPVYSTTEVNVVSGLETTDKDVLETNFDEKAVKKTFYIKEGEAAETSVGIVIADAGEIADALKNGGDDVGLADGKANYDGSFVVLSKGQYSSSNDAADDALEAVRIGLVIYGTDANGQDTATAELKIWEPNADLTALATATYATNGVTADPVEPVVQSAYHGKIGSFDADGNFVETNTYTSGELFTLQDGDTDGVRVDVFMWFEGQDDSCVNEIMADSIIAQLKFVALD